MKVLEGIKVVEAAQWIAAPAAARILADWGAEVVRIEHPTMPDPLRGVLPTLMGRDDVHDFYMEHSNSSKRSIGVDLKSPEGKEIFNRLIKDADVFVTSFLEVTREKWGMGYEQLRAVNPRLVYARVSGQGMRGPDAHLPGYDPTSFWARSSAGYMAAPKDGRPAQTPSGGFGDVQGGLALAGGIAAALVRRSVTGEGGLVDVSLLNIGMWDMYETIQFADVFGVDPKTERPGSVPAVNPLVGIYMTKDGRDISLCMLQSDRHWPDFCAALGWGDLVQDPRFDSFAARAENFAELTAMITDHFAAHEMSDLIARLKAHECVFSPFQKPGELRSDPQVQANGFVVPHPDDHERVVVASPVQFDEQPNTIRSRSPHTGEHTEEVLLELGYDWDGIVDLKRKGVVT